MALSQQLVAIQTNKTKTIKQQFFLAFYSKHLLFIQASSDRVSGDSMAIFVR